MDDSNVDTHVLAADESPHLNYASVLNFYTSGIFLLRDAYMSWRQHILSLYVLLYNKQLQRLKVLIRILRSPECLFCYMV